VERVGTYRARIGSQEIDLPIVPLAEDLAVALLITVDHGVQFATQAGRDLAELFADQRIEVVASVATMGIPIAIEVTRALGLDDYLIFQKTPKIHLGDAISEPVKSITTGSLQRLLFDRARIDAARGRRVALVDDVVSTGASLRAALNLLRHVDAQPVAIGTLATEADEWRTTLGADADLIRSLGSLPLFRRDAHGEFVANGVS
jgi:adenine/guanine phosphoribosyltransferase-like PRPP-binding protein